MQFCPRCGSRNQDDRAACWKCFAQLQKAGGKAQRILLQGADAPPVGAPIVAKEAEEPVAPIAPIPELAEPEAAIPTPDLTFDLPAAEPEVAEEPAPAVAPLADVMMPSPSFDSDQTETPTEPAPILGLANLPEEESPTFDLDKPDEVPHFEAREIDEEPLVVEPADDAQSLEGTGEEALPWWMTQDETEEAPTAEKDKPILDLDDGGLEILPADDTRKIVSFEDEDEDPDSEKSPPAA